MNTFKNFNFFKFISIFLLSFLMFLVYRLFETNEITPYGLINWFVSYEDGFARRCLMATFYNSLKYFLNDSDFNLSLIPIIHKLCIIFLLFTIAYIVFKSKNFTLIVCSSFLLIASPAIKNAIFLTGYTDIYLLVLILLILIFRAKNYLLLVFLCIFISGLIHELSFFLLLPIISIDLYFTYNNDRPRFSFIFIIYILGLFSIILTFMCNFDTDTLIRSLSNKIPQQASLKTIYNALNEHYSLKNLFIKRFVCIIDNFQNFVFAFILLSWQGLLCSYLFVVKGMNIKMSEKLIISMLALAPCSVVLVATDLWRLLSLYTFSIFTVLVYVDSRLPTSFHIRTTAQKWAMILISFTVSFVSACFPYQMITTERMGYNGIPNATYKKFLGNSVFVDIGYELNLFYNYWNGLYDNYTTDVPRTCFRSGNKAMQLLISPGLKNLTIYSNPNGNTSNSITIGNYKINLNGESEVSFNFYSDASVVNKGAYIIYCNPTSEDWYINRIDIKSLE